VVIKAQRREIRRDASTARRLDTSLLNALIFKRRNQRTSPRKRASKQGNLGSTSKRV